VKIAIALGGGAAKGYAHLGVLKEIQKAGIHIDIVTGTSIGSLMGGVYATTGDAYKTIEKILAFVQSDKYKDSEIDFFDELKKSSRSRIWDKVGNLLRKGYMITFSLTREGMISEENYYTMIDALVDEYKIEDLPIKFGTVSLDLISGDRVVIKDGGLRFAVAASSAIPGVFPPVVIGDRQLVDGGWVENIPIILAKEMGADFVIAVDLGEEIEDAPPLVNGLNVVMRADDISRHYLKQFYLKDADIVISPDVKDIFWASFREVEKGIHRGENEMKKRMDELKKLLNEKGLSL